MYQMRSATCATLVSRKLESKEKLSKNLGVVKAHIGIKEDMSREMTSAKLIQAIEKGLPVSELEALQASLEIPLEVLAQRLGISRATLHRRKTSGRLAPDESDRVVRFARLMGKAMGIFTTEADARLWLTSPQVGLGGAVPLEYATTEVGAREVENLLGRIEYGVYS